MAEEKEKSQKEYMIFRQLEKMEHLFLWLSRCYYQEDVPVVEWKKKTIEQLLTETEQYYCGKCSKIEMCHEKKRRALMEKGELQSDDVISYFTCHRGETMLRNVNQRYQNEMQQLRMQQQKALQQKFFISQYKAAAEMIRDCMNQWEQEYVHIDLVRKARQYGLEIGQYFQREGGDPIECCVLLKTRKGEKTAREIAGILSEILGKKIRPKTQCRSVAGNRFVWMEFQEEPRFYILSRGMRIPCRGQSVCGDQFTLAQMKDHCFAAMICDGLGTGEMPEKESRSVIELFEHLLEHDISEEHAVEMVKASMFFSPSHERYVTLDCMLIDLYTGIGKIIKLGSAETFIIRGQAIETVEGSEPPVGACFDRRTPFVRKKLNHGDMIVMVSDGVIDEFGGKERFAEFLSLQNENCPQILCEKIADQMKERKDDGTILVFGIWNK